MAFVLPEQDYQFEDFTENGYRQLLRLTQQHYRFETFGTSQTDKHVLWRHDIDFSVHRARRLAQIEKEESVKATYFVLLHSVFYNVLEKEITQLIEEILSSGHELGLHFDSAYYDNIDTIEKLTEKVQWEKNLLEGLFGTPVQAVSFHNPDVGSSLHTEYESIAGLKNTYAPSLQKRYGYCSDSNGYWRYRRLFDVISEAKENYMQVLTHPEWWVPEPMSPRERVTRCIDGRANATHRLYDSLMDAHGRQNIGKQA